MKKIKLVLLLFITAGILTSCFKDADDESGFSTALDIQSFIYRGLNVFYLYKSETPELRDGYFNSQTELQDFLSGFESPESLFNYLLAEQDRFSFLIHDYRLLEKMLDGISVSNGMQFGLVRIENTNTVFGYVRYVLPNTSAAQQKIKRGMIFSTIDKQKLTVDNYRELIDKSSYTIGLAKLVGDQLIPTQEYITLEKNQYTENPVHINKVLEIDGHKIGYLMYNSFTADFDSELNSVFAEFKAAGITDLVLDLRYNGGGSIESANDLSSMITGQFKGKLFIKQVYNNNFEPQKRFFNDKIEATGGSINNLNLNKLYVLTSRNTASASELILSGLRPYIDIVQIGTTTTGKFQGSTILYDSPNFGRKDRSLGHRYAMLPLILKSVNAQGFTDYANGIAPDIVVPEDYTDLGVLGTPNENLLHQAILKIRGLSGKTSVSHKTNASYEVIYESDQNSPIYQRMF